jgi:hypothetical protein
VSLEKPRGIPLFRRLIVERAVAEGEASGVDAEG